MVHAMVRTDISGRITHWDEGAEQLFGHTVVAAVGQPVDLIVPEDFRDAHWNGFRRAMERPEIKDMAADLPVLCADGVSRRMAPGLARGRGRSPGDRG
jgi:PAS domain S-box-containing protein